ncbi:MAG: murein DD-endopeptidase [Myxococcota bacterium]|jgi:murein DD-endopeptidase
MKWIDPPDGRPWALIGLCAFSILANAALAVVVLSGGDDPGPAAASAVVELPDDALAPSLPPEAGVANVSSEPPREDAVKLVRAPVSHSLARTFQAAVPDHADVVSAVYTRLFVWELDVRRDVQKGDEIALAYAWDGELADIAVAEYASKRLGRTLKAFRFQASGDTWPSWWDESGVEVPRRLVNGPLRDYEQITSLLKDRPTHKGMDFKSPVGTALHTPRAGKVLRTNWNTVPNGGCIEIEYSDGVVAKFLHLSDVKVSPGDSVGAGSVIGLTGNTGRSTAPHLHYELARGGKVLDPTDYHGVVRRKLTDADLPRFERERDRLAALLAHEQTASR